MLSLHTQIHTETQDTDIPATSYGELFIYFIDEFDSPDNWH